MPQAAPSKLNYDGFCVKNYPLIFNTIKSACENNIHSMNFREIPFESVKIVRAAYRKAGFQVAMRKSLGFLGIGAAVTTIASTSSMTAAIVAGAATAVVVAYTIVKNCRINTAENAPENKAVFQEAQQKLNDYISDQMKPVRAHYRSGNGNPMLLPSG